MLLGIVIGPVENVAETVDVVEDDEEEEEEEEEDDTSLAAVFFGSHVKLNGLLDLSHEVPNENAGLISDGLAISWVVLPRAPNVNAD